MPIFLNTLKPTQLLRKVPVICIVFIATALMGGLFFAIKTPIGYTSDESVHIFKTYQVSRGHLIPRAIGTQQEGNQKLVLYGGDVPTSIIALEQYTSAGIRHVALCDQLACGKLTNEQERHVKYLSSQPVRTPHQDIYFWGANAYFFIPYLPGALGMGVAQVLNTSAGNAIILSRIFSLLFYVLLVGMAIYLLRGNRIKWVVFAIGTLPISVSQAASSGVDMFLNACSLLLFALVVRAYLNDKATPRWALMLATALAIVLPLCKLPYILLSLSLLFVPNVIGDRNRGLHKLVLATVITIPTLIWGILSARYSFAQNVLTHAGNSVPNFGDQLTFIMLHPYEYILILLRSILANDWLGQLGALTQQGLFLPSTLLWPSLTLIFVGSLYAATDLRSHLTNRRHFIVTLVLAALLSSAAIITSLYLAYNPTGHHIIEGVQGRYFLPVLPFLALGLAVLLPIRVQTSAKGPRPATLFYAASGLLMISSIIFYYGKVYVWL